MQEVYTKYIYIYIASAHKNQAAHALKVQKVGPDWTTPCSSWAEHIEIRNP